MGCLTQRLFVLTAAWVPLLVAVSDCAGRSLNDGIAGAMSRVYEYNEEGRRIGILKRTMRYRYFLPQGYDPSVEYPLVLSLHGSGESGTNNTSQLIYLQNMVNQTETTYPAIVVAPQLESSVGWYPGGAYDRTEEMLDRLFSELSIDPNRLYLTGLSMGGFGTMNYLHYFNAYEQGEYRFAAGAPAAGAGIDPDPDTLDALRNTPIWMAHGSADNIVDPDSSRYTFNVLAGNEPNAPIEFTQRGAGGPMAEFGNVRYTEYPGVGHGSWGPFYDSPDLYEWMFAQRLVPEPTSFAVLLIGIAIVAPRRWR